MCDAADTPGELPRLCSHALQSTIETGRNRTQGSKRPVATIFLRTTKNYAAGLQRPPYLRKNRPLNLEQYAEWTCAQRFPGIDDCHSCAIRCGSQRSTLSELSVTGNAPQWNGPAPGHRLPRHALGDGDPHRHAGARHTAIGPGRAPGRAGRPAGYPPDRCPAERKQRAARGHAPGRSDTFIIRGFRTQIYAIDGVLVSPTNTFSSVSRDLADVERVEVLKGPASVLYGRGDPGGLIHIVTRQPTLEPSGDINLQAVASDSAGSRARSRVRSRAWTVWPDASALPASPTRPSATSAAGTIPVPSWHRPSHGTRARTRVSRSSRVLTADTQYDEGAGRPNGRVPLDNIARYYGEPFARYNSNSNFSLLRVEHDLNENITLPASPQRAMGRIRPVDDTGYRAGQPQHTRESARGHGQFDLCNRRQPVRDGGEVRSAGLQAYRSRRIEYTNGYRTPTRPRAETTHR